MNETQDQRDPGQKPENKGQSGKAAPVNTPAKPLSHLEAKRAQNLRDNLARRKQQTRARQTDENSED